MEKSHRILHGPIDRLGQGLLVCLVILAGIGIYHPVAGIGPDFTISATDNISFNSGATGSSAITATNLTPSQGSTYSVNLTYTVSPSIGLSVDLNPGVLICKPSGCGPSWAGAWSVGPSTAKFASSVTGEYTVNVTGTSDFSSHSVLVHVFVTDFSMDASPSVLTVQAGRSGSSTITIRTLAGFDGRVGLTASVSPSGPIVSLDTASVTGGDNTKLTVKVGSGVTYGNYTVTVHGTSQGLSRRANVTVTVESFKPASLVEIFGPDPTMFYGIIGLAVIVIVAALAFVMRRRTRPKVA